MAPWADKGAYARAAAKLKGLFEDNYAQYRKRCSAGYEDTLKTQIWLRRLPA